MRPSLFKGARAVDGTRTYIGDAIGNRSTASARAVFSGTRKLLSGEMMPTTNIPKRDGHGRSAPAGRRRNDGRARPSGAACLSQFMLLAIVAYFCSVPALWAQTSDSQTDFSSSTMILSILPSRMVCQNEIKKVASTLDLLSASRSS